MIYALGRGLQHYDMPVLRQVVRGAAKEQYRFSALVTGIVESAPFRMRSKGERATGDIAASAPVKAQGSRPNWTDRIR
jgi:hypothetical protein